MTTKHVMGWRPGPMAERSTLKAALKRRTPKGDRFYKSSIVLDQGSSQLSAAHALWHWLVIHDRSFVGVSPEGLVRLATPRLVRANAVTTTTIEVLVGMLTTHGVIARTYWTRHADHLRDALLQSLGPAIVGLPWLDAMMQPNAEGYIMAAGKRVGRHCVVIVGYDQERDAFRLLNSWGSAWGQLGRAWIRRRDLALLLAQGEACVPVLASDTKDERARWMNLLLQDRS